MPEQQHDDEWWLNHANLDERTRTLLRRRRRHASTGSRIFFAVFLIVVGVLLFLDNIGVLRVRNLWDYWPLILVAAGMGRLMNCRNTSGRFIGFFLTIIGIVTLLVTLGILHLHTRNGSWPLALVLIAFGVALLIKVLEPGGSRRSFGLPAPATEDTNNVLNDFAVLGGIKRKLETGNFQGGTIVSVLGGVEIDLRRSQISTPERTATLDIKAVFAGTKIRVPETWKVNVIGASILGSYEDKTIPPNTGPHSPTLVITGYSLFASVEIEN
jgi:predicted membrane protein